MSQVTRIEIGTRPGLRDSRGESVARQVRSLLGIAVDEVRTRDVYHILPGLEEEQARRVAEVFAGPVLRRGAVGRLEGRPFDVAISVGYRPGVTDPVARSARVAIEDLLGIELGPDGAVFTSRLYLLCGVDPARGEVIARELLANEVIERIQVAGYEQWLEAGPDLSVPQVRDTAPPPVATVDLELDDASLEKLSREKLLALTLEEMKAIRAFFHAAASDSGRAAAGLAGSPTDAELECLAQTWSEHCKHKIFNATITCQDEGGEREIRSLFKELIRGTTEKVERRLIEREGRSWLVSVFHDNAGVIEATERHHLVYKVETHNSPSALDPYGGAITGIVGVNRDPFGTGLGAELLANVWGYCFAEPDRKGDVPAGLLHPRRIREGVHRGVIDGGNQSGIPYGRGFEIFDERFLGKPLVYCGTVGRMPVTVAGRPAHEKRARPGDRVVMVGGRIGKDGIHGATFSSAELTEDSPVQAVQIGDPITEKMMFDFLLEARDRGLYSAITDNGAGGLSSSVGEMAEGPGGAKIDLARAPLKYQGLAPWEILVSEAQERMTLAVPPGNLEQLLDLARRREVEATDLGEFTDDGLFCCTFGGKTVVRLPMEFLHDGLPEMRLHARFQPPVLRSWNAAPPPDPIEGTAQAEQFLARFNIASGEELCRTYDHEVKALTVVKPWVGVHRDVPSDASVFQVDHAGWEGYALSEGIFPTYSDHDARAMAQAAVDLAVRRLVVSGARPDRIAGLDNFCWPDPLPGPGNPDAEHKLAQLVRACEGLHASCVAHDVPLISGKDSMKNDAVVGGRRISIPPTLLFSAIGIVPDVRTALTLEGALPGHRLLLLGETADELGGSEWAASRGSEGEGSVPRCRPEQWAERYRRLAQVLRDRLVVAAHAPGRGGLLPALLRLARAADCGAWLDLDALPVDGSPGWEARLYGESCGRVLLCCRAEDAGELAERLSGQPLAEVGGFDTGGRIEVRWRGEPLVRGDVGRMVARWKRAPENRG